MPFCSTQKHHFAYLAIVLLAACAHTPANTRSGERIALGPKIEPALTEQLELLTTLTSDPTIIAFVSESNAKIEQLSPEQQQKRKQAWQQQPDKEIVTALLTNAAAMKILEFQEQHPGFSELFITDRSGLNVAQSNPTSDYSQADEAWWQTTYSQGNGRANHGEIEYDQSADSDAISFGVPIMQNQRVIGVLKGVLDILSIQQSFWGNE